jgi:hypothetical protein
MRGMAPLGALYVEMTRESETGIELVGVVTLGKEDEP